MNGADSEPRRQLPTTAAREMTASQPKWHQLCVEYGGLLEIVFFAIKVTFAGYQFMTDFYSQNRCVCSARSHGPLLCAFCLSFHFKDWRETYYDYRNGDYCAMHTHLRQIDWDAVFGEQRTNSKFEAFQHVMEECVQRFIPEKSRRKKRPWFTRKVERASRKKYHLWKKYQETKEYHIYTSYKRQ